MWTGSWRRLTSIAARSALPKSDFVQLYAVDERNIPRVEDVYRMTNGLWQETVEGAAALDIQIAEKFHDAGGSHESQA